MRMFCKLSRGSEPHPVKDSRLKSKEIVLRFRCIDIFHHMLAQKKLQGPFVFAINARVNLTWRTFRFRFGWTCSPKTN